MPFVLGDGWSLEKFPVGQCLTWAGAWVTSSVCVVVLPFQTPVIPAGGALVQGVIGELFGAMGDEQLEQLVGFVQFKLAQSRPHKEVGQNGLTDVPWN